MHNFTYFASPVISRLQQLQGPLAGGTPIRVHGEHFHRGGGRAVCRFGEATVPATRADEYPAVLECRSPPASHAGDVALEISLNGADFTASRADGNELSQSRIDASARQQRARTAKQRADVGASALIWVLVRRCGC